MNNTLLLVDDDNSIIESLTPVLKRAGFDVKTASNGIDALDKIANISPEAVILDVDMPKLDGRAVLRQLRAKDNWVPVILLTKHGDSMERTMALEEGADDYLNKPFPTHELIARVRSILRRANRGVGQLPLTAATELISEQLKFNRQSRRAYLLNEELNLTNKATLLLDYFLLHSDEVISRDRLLDSIWGWSHPAGGRTVDTRVAELRKALKDDSNSPTYIETIPGEGYRWIGHVTAQH